MSALRMSLLVSYMLHSHTTGPSPPFKPESVDTTVTTFTTAQIQWSVPSIAYTPEQYTVEYGTSPGSLSQSSAVVSGSTDLAAVDHQYSMEVTGLLEGSTYYYRVVAHNTHGSTSSNVYTFTVEDVRKLPDFGTLLAYVCC